jgi:hypothetical protein
MQNNTNDTVPDRRQLPYLLKLLDDESPAVRDSIARELASFGSSLKKELEKLQMDIPASQLNLITRLLDEYNRSRLLERWPSVFAVAEEKQRLEKGLALLAAYQHGDNHGTRLSTLLDELSAKCDAMFPGGDAEDLGVFLFSIVQLRGVEQDQYYNPLNSSLTYAIESKRGIPITLTCVYMLVGCRLGLRIEGCNFPGHFLAIASFGDRKAIVDCFNGGRLINDYDLRGIRSSISIEDILRLECDTNTILTRVLRNLTNAYQRQENTAQVHLVEQLLQQVPGNEDQAAQL